MFGVWKIDHHGFGWGLQGWTVNNVVTFRGLSGIVTSKQEKWKNKYNLQLSKCGFHRFPANSALYSWMSILQNCPSEIALIDHDSERGILVPFFWVFLGSYAILWSFQDVSTLTSSLELFRTEISAEQQSRAEEAAEAQRTQEELNLGASKVGDGSKPYVVNRNWRCLKFGHVFSRTGVSDTTKRY